MQPSDEGSESLENQASTPTDTAEPRRSRRPTGLLRDQGLRFVNNMRNVGWLAGYAMPGDGDTFLLQQTNNIEHALPIKVKGKHANVTKVAGRPVMAMVHLRGYRDEHGPQVSLHCIQLDKPSILDLPVEQVWLSGFGGTTGKDAAKTLAKLSKSSFSPFDANGEVRPEYKDYIASADSESKQFTLDERAQSFMEAAKMLGDVLDASGGVVDSRLDRGQNYVSVAGFVDSKAYVPATEHRKDYGLIMVRQHEDQEANIPVRVTGRMAKTYIQKLAEGTPVLVEGSIRRKVIPNDAGAIVSVHTYIECVRVSTAQVDVDIKQPVPAWWASIRERLLERSRNRAAAQGQAKATKAVRAPSAEDLSAVASEL